MTDGTVVSETFDFKIKAVALGGASLTKEVSVTVTICGSESITPADSSEYSKWLSIDPNAVAFDVSLASLFESSDPYCPPNQFKLTVGPDYASQVDPPSSELPNYNISGLNLRLFPKDQGTYTFHVLAHSVTDKFAFRKVSFQVRCTASSQVVTLADQSQLTVEIDKN
jgi:hypothetical protein